MSNTDTPATITPAILTLSQRLSPDRNPGYVSVQPFPGAREMECYPNVKSKVASSGGSIVYGWQIWEWPDVYLEAEFHAVWKAPTGELVDLTPKDQPTPRILFLEDPVRRYENRMVANVLAPLSDTTEVLELVEACNATGAFLEQNLVGGIQMDSSAARRYIALLERKQAALDKVSRSANHNEPTLRNGPKLGRNDKCYCGSGQKYKKCHLASDVG